MRDLQQPNCFSIATDASGVIQMFNICAVRMLA